MCKEKDPKNDLIKKEKRIPEIMAQGLVHVFAITDFPADIRVRNVGDGYVKAESEVPSELENAWDLLVDIACKLSLIQIVSTIHNHFNEKRD